MLLVTFEALGSSSRRVFGEVSQGRLLPTGERLVRDVSEKGGEQGVLIRSS